MKPISITATQEQMDALEPFWREVDRNPKTTMVMAQIYETRQIVVRLITPEELAKEAGELAEKQKMRRTFQE